MTREEMIETIRDWVKYANSYMHMGHSRSFDALVHKINGGSVSNMRNIEQSTALAVLPRLTDKELEEIIEEFTIVETHSWQDW